MRGVRNFYVLALGEKWVITGPKRLKVHCADRNDAVALARGLARDAAPSSVWIELANGKLRLDTGFGAAKPLPVRR